jgi:hypothetical protein
VLAGSDMVIRVGAPECRVDVTVAPSLSACRGAWHPTTVNVKPLDHHRISTVSSSSPRYVLHVSMAAV